MSLKTLLVNKFPQVGKLKRWYKAYKDSIQSKNSYAQHKEDIITEKYLTDYDLQNGVYVDVGANHPTDISNTFLFYKKGLHGVTIEPIPELVQLHQKFRPRDIILPIGISNKPNLLTFNVTKFPVISSFDKAHITTLFGYKEDVIWKKIYMPILTLDTALANIPIEWIFFLSIDVEGLDFQVIEGASEILKKTYCLLIEFATDEEAEKLKVYLNDFDFKEQISCNLLFINKSPIFNKYKKD